MEGSSFALRSRSAHCVDELETSLVWKRVVGIDDHLSECLRIDQTVDGGFRDVLARFFQQGGGPEKTIRKANRQFTKTPLFRRHGSLSRISRACTILLYLYCGKTSFRTMVPSSLGTTISRMARVMGSRTAVCRLPDMLSYSTVVPPLFQLSLACHKRRRWATEQKGFGCSCPSHSLSSGHIQHWSYMYYSEAKYRQPMEL